MSYTIQQIEKMNFYENIHTEEELIPIARQMIKLKKYEKALEILEAAIEKVIQKHNGDEIHIECALYYFHYADSIITKLMDEEDLFDNHYETETTHNIQDNPNDSNDEYEEGRSNAELPCDEEIAFENLAVAEKILLNQNDKSSQDLLANVYLKMGELEMCKSDFKKAIPYFEKALKIRKQMEDKFSRAIAEIYFNMGSIYDFDSNKCLLCYYKTKIIIEYHLKNMLKEVGDDIKINEDELDLEEINKDNIIFYKNLIMNENISEEAAELIDIINHIYTKVIYLLI
jgi:tetratricopeptide (TPR) repeat protein